jgi:hypothetical protein
LLFSQLYKGFSPLFELDPLIVLPFTKPFVNLRRGATKTRSWQ